MFLDNFCGYLVPCNYVSIRKRGTRGIDPNLRGAQFEGSKTPWGAECGVQNYAGQALKANLHFFTSTPE